MRGQGTKTDKAAARKKSRTVFLPSPEMLLGGALSSQDQLQQLPAGPSFSALLKCPAWREDHILVTTVSKLSTKS